MRATVLRTVTAATASPYRPADRANDSSIGPAAPSATVQQQRQQAAHAQGDADRGQGALSDRVFQALGILVGGGPDMVCGGVCRIGGDVTHIAAEALDERSRLVQEIARPLTHRAHGIPTFL